MNLNNNKALNKKKNILEMFNWNYCFACGESFKHHTMAFHHIRDKVKIISRCFKLSYGDLFHEVTKTGNMHTDCHTQIERNDFSHIKKEVNKKIDEYWKNNLKSNLLRIINLSQEDNLLNPVILNFMEIPVTIIDLLKHDEPNLVYWSNILEMDAIQFIKDNLHFSIDFDPVALNNISSENSTNVIPIVLDFYGMIVPIVDSKPDKWWTTTEIYDQMKLFYNHISNQRKKTIMSGISWMIRHKFLKDNLFIIDKNSSGKYMIKKKIEQLT